MREYGHLSPKQLVPRLADEGRYLASESTMYRLQTPRRLEARAAAGASHARHAGDAPSISAVRANQVWSWDITYLPTVIRGRFLRLYLVMDVWSRRIVGWDVHDDESAEPRGHADSAHLRRKRRRSERAGAALGQWQADAREHDDRHVTVAGHRPVV